MIFGNDLKDHILSWGDKTTNATAIVDDTYTVSHHELVRRTKAIASSLRRSGLGENEPVGIVFEAGYKQVIAQVAVSLAGGTCVPISPANPASRIIDMLRDIEAERLITDRYEEFQSEGLTLVCLSDMEVQGLGIHDDPASAQHNVHRTHILFTSGSTGKPKAVQISSENILHLAKKTPVTPLSPDDRLAAFNDPGFDLSLFEIWVTLLSGACIVFTPRMTVTDPFSLQKFLADQRITIMMIPTALFHIVTRASPGIFRGLKHVLTAGEVVSSAAMRAVLENGPPRHLWNAYGPTESTTFVTMHEITMEETRRDRIGIGSPVGQMKIFLLDEELNVINESQERGEICIAGPQLSAGYVNSPDTNEVKFVQRTTNQLNGAESATTVPSSTISLFRTGDIGEWRQDGRILDFIGRADNQVKVGGFRVELEDVEKTLLESGLIKSTAVAFRQATGPGHVGSLIAFVVPENEGRFKADELITFSRARLPHYMVPNKVEMVSEVPLNSRGKVDRQALFRSLERGVLQNQVNGLGNGAGNKSTCNGRKVVNGHANGYGNGHSIQNQPTNGLYNGSASELLLRNIWSDILDVSQISEDDDLIALGATSLQSAALIAQIKTKMGRLISMHDLHRNSKFSQLLKFIVGDEESVTAPDGSAKWIQDIETVDCIETVPDWWAEDEGRIFLTGVTGFVGAFFLEQLLLDPDVKQVACLVRADTAVEAARRIQENMEKYDLWPVDFALTSKMKILVGDMSLPFLGLGKDSFDWLATWASAIFHLAAKVNYCESYEGHYAANIQGTRYMLDLAVAGRRKTFHYMSSIDVWGQTGHFLGTKVVLEDEDVQPHLQGVRYEVGYAQSKWAAEGMVRRMKDRGLPVVIYRPGFTMGHSETGASNPKDFMSRIIVGCIQLGVWPSLQSRIEYVTVDYVVKTMLHISRSRKNLGRCFTLLSPTIRDSVPFNDTCTLVKKAGYAISLISYRDWVNELIERGSPTGPLAPALPLLEEKVLGGLTRLELCQNSPFYDSRNTLEALEGRDDIQYVPLTTQLVKRYIAFWKRKGFYSV
ncbi:hypothetical protein CP532_5537 [Ophiocordyceps camponoti-leonardi (nom. inval.)]|nr:hypothetical protein CP532_5537 [Ophiocordyceps camponoti-leonardi (nom. inval.)]